MFKFTLLLIGYTITALLMCAFIMANEGNESLENQSPVSAVRSTQRGSIVEYIIWFFAVLFLTFVVILNRSAKPNLVSTLLKTEKSQTITTEETPVKIIETNPVSSDMTDSIISPIIESVA